MTNPGEQSPSQFNAQSDKAAQALRGLLNKQGAEMPETAPVQVGPDGKPPAPLPPQGSYIRQAMEAKRAQDGQPTEQQVVGDQPPAGTTQQAMDGSQAPKLSTGQPPQEPQEQAVSPNAERRIKDLVDRLRERDQALQQMQTQFQQGQTSQQEMAKQFNDLQQQHQQMLQANLDNMDPEDRSRVIQDARMGELFGQLEERLDQKYGPQIKALSSKSEDSEYTELSEIFPAFDLVVHKDLIAGYRGKNPYSSIRQAYQAIAVGDELMTREQASASAVPPVLPPGAGNVEGVRYIARPEAPQASPDAQVQSETERMAALNRSTDPNERKQGYDLALSNLANRIRPR